MGSLHFIGGEKGGVGKSVMARVLAQYLIDREAPVTGFDTDRSHASFTRFYEDYAHPVIIDKYESLDAVIEVFDEKPDQNVIVDLAAQTFAPVSRWILDSGLFEAAKEMEISVNLWHVMDDGKESIQLLGRQFEMYGTAPCYVIVLNEGRGSDFSVFEDSDEREKARQFYAKIMILPKLHDATMRKIDLFNSSFWAAVNNKGKYNKALGILERQRVKVWLRKAYSTLEGVLEVK